MTRTPEQDERRDHAIDAVKRNLTDDLRAIGWLGVFETIESGWTIFENGRPADRLPYQERLAWVSLLGHLDARVVRAGLREWTATEQGAHCPKPGEFASMLSGRTKGDPSPTNLPQKRRPDQQPEVLTFVASLIDGGEPVCECHPAPPQLVIDDRGVLWAPCCAGIETGQVDQAREFVSPSVEPDVAIHDLPAVLRLRKIRSERADGVRL